MKKFLAYIQTSYNYSDYQIKLIKYFILTIASEFSKLIVIFGTFAYLGYFYECVIAIASLIFLRLSGGGYHCEHYITCFLFSFSFVSASVFLGACVPLPRIAIIGVMIVAIVSSFYCAPIISRHRGKPTVQLIRNSRFFNILFLSLFAIVVTAFFQNQYVLTVFWICALYTIQLVFAKLQKGGYYYAT